MRYALNDFATQIAAGESANVEFKTSFNQEAVEAICAFANKRGGVVFIGLKNSEKILGVQLAQESLQTWLNDSYLSTLRNKAIANLFHELGEIEKYGSGVTRVLQMFREAGNPELKIESTSTGVKVTAFALGVKVADKVVDKVADKVADKTELTEAEKKVLATIDGSNGCKISLIIEKTGFSNSYIRKNLASLVEKKLVERRGSKKTGGYFVV